MKFLRVKKSMLDKRRLMFTLTEKSVAFRKAESAKHVQTNVLKELP